MVGMVLELLMNLRREELAVLFDALEREGTKDLLHVLLGALYPVKLLGIRNLLGFKLRQFRGCIKVGDKCAKRSTDGGAKREGHDQSGCVHLHAPSTGAAGSGVGR